MLHGCEVQASEDVVWCLGDVIVHAVSLDLIMRHIQELWVHRFEIVSVVASLAAQDCFSICRHVGVLAIDYGSDAIAAASLPRFALPARLIVRRELGARLAHVRVGLPVHILVPIPLLCLSPVAVEVQDRFQRRLGEIIRYHLVLLWPDTSIARAVGELVQLLRVPICLWVLMPGTAVVEIGIVHRSNIFWYLFKCQINVLLIAL